MRLTVFFLSVLVLALTFQVSADPPSVVDYGPATQDDLRSLVDSSEWTPTTRTRLAQALAGEAGFLPDYRREAGRVRSCIDGETCYPNRDWRIIPWTLLTRWKHVRDGGADVSFLTLVESYCASVRPDLASRAQEEHLRIAGLYAEARQVQRRRFLLSLDWNRPRVQTHDEVTGRGVEGYSVDVGFTAIRAVVEAWERGEVPNECEGASHWDGPHWAPQSRRMVRMSCGETLNVFYGVPRPARRSET